MLSNQSNINIESEDEQELMEECIDEDIWRKYRLSEWSEDVTVTWIRSVVGDSVNGNDYNHEQIYLLTEMIMMHGYDGNKLKKEHFIKCHPSLLSPAKRHQIVQKMINFFVLSV